MIYVKDLTLPCVIGEILKVKKNRYSHIDRSFFQDLELEEVFDDLAAFGMIFVE